ncbi:hypothetical protein AVEN_61487-1 [Araneus ventricosus]|uniref:Uncharacterized protein n=1 Tax=Araneus ventricosus TaxID=182803 RepID=A0A4Y2AIJ3_ARAVE|nr:hypothetical protein AVEN_61487-1 [Araneus ventricosus]
MQRNAFSGTCVCWRSRGLNMRINRREMELRIGRDVSLFGDDFVMTENKKSSLFSIRQHWHRFRMRKVCHFLHDRRMTEQDEMGFQSSGDREYDVIELLVNGNEASHFV